MPRWSRILNVLRGDRVSREIDEELASHLDEAIAQGRDPSDARRALGSPLRLRERSRDVRISARLDALRADAIFGWRQIRKHAATSAAAILSLALAIGACTSAFRLIDALLLRPLPVAAPERLYALTRFGYWPDGRPSTSDGWEHPAFRRLRAAVHGDGIELLAISYAARVDLTYAADHEMEKAQLQYVSGSMFDTFGLRPAIGRLLAERDDETPGAHPHAVLSHDYWTRRFGQDPRIAGRTFRLGAVTYEIVGVVRPPFTGTEPGTVVDIFVPAMMHADAQNRGSTWLRLFAILPPGTVVEPLRARLHATFRGFQEERARGFTGMSKERLDRFINRTLSIEPAPTGASRTQADYRRSLTALGTLVALVLLIACANVANLMTTQAASRAREMALRVSIGAGRGRLVQLVLVESAWLAGLAALLGGLFSWAAAPFVVSLINPPDNPARLVLPLDWRVLGFGLALTAGVTALFGLWPALRASAVTPVSALKGGEDPHARRRVMHALIAAQVAFCVVVLFVAGLFVATFDRLAHQPTGFSSERLLTLETDAAPAQPPAAWEEVADRLRAIPGVERVGLADRALLDGSGSNNFLTIDGRPASEVLAWFRRVTPGWLDLMKIPLIAGRDFAATDMSRDASRQPAIVNEAFAKQFFDGANPVGRSFERTGTGRYEIVGLVRDARYRTLREPIPPTAYIPIHVVDTQGTPQASGSGMLLVRTASADPLALAPLLRREVARARPEFRVRNIRTQTALHQSQTVRERLLATMALFFAGVALLLAAVGLYGVLHYSVLQRRREIGIRLALGARTTHVARRITAEVFLMVIAGAAAGLALGLASERYLATLFYQVKATDPAMLAWPALTMLVASLVAALPPVIRASRIDPIKTLRAD